MNDNNFPDDNTDNEQECTFDDLSETISEEIERYRYKWTLKAVTWYDFDDVKNVIFNHINNKFHLWDQSRPLLPFIRKTIGNQMINMLRNKYYKYQRPCEKCAMYRGNDLCDIFGEISVSCSIYKKWHDYKQNGCHIQLPVTIENHLSDIQEMPCNYFDLEHNIDIFHDYMMKNLPKNLKVIYKFLYIDHESEEDLALFLGYKSKEKNRKSGYKMIYNHKKNILNFGMKGLKDNLIDIL